VVERGARRHHGWQSLAMSQHRGHLWGDVFALLAVAVVLALLTPRARTA